MRAQTPAISAQEAEVPDIVVYGFLMSALPLAAGIYEIFDASEVIAVEGADMSGLESPSDVGPLPEKLLIL